MPGCLAGHHPTITSAAPQPSASPDLMSLIPQGQVLLATQPQVRKRSPKQAVVA